MARVKIRQPISNIVRSNGGDFPVGEKRQIQVRNRARLQDRGLLTVEGKVGKVLGKGFVERQGTAGRSRAHTGKSGLRHRQTLLGEKIRNGGF